MLWLCQSFLLQQNIQKQHADVKRSFRGIGRRVGWGENSPPRWAAPRNANREIGVPRGLEDADFGDGGGQFGDVNPDGGSLPLVAFNVQLEIFAVENP